MLIDEIIKRKREANKWLVVFVVFSFVLVSWAGVIDKRSTDYIDEALLQAGVAFGVAKLINGTVSVLQSVELSFTPVGVGTNIGIGQILDPINDMVEKFSEWMKLSIISLVIQKTLLQIVSDVVFKILITVSGVALAVSVLIKSDKFSAAVMKTFVFLVFLRFSLVFVVLANGYVDRMFIDEKVNNDIASLESLPGEVERLKEGAEAITEEERKDLSSATEQLKKDRAELLAEKERQHASLEILSEEEKKKKDIVEVKQEGVPYHRRFSTFANDEDLIKANKDLEMAQAMVKAQKEELDAIDKAISVIDGQVESNNNRLEGRSGGFAQSVADGIASWGRRAAGAANALRLASIRERLDQATTTMLNVTALFILKTMMLPIIFLLALVRITKTIWRIDLSEFLASREGADSKLKISHHDA